MQLVMSRSIHCFTLSRGGRAESYLGQQRRNKTSFIRELVQKIAQTQYLRPIVVTKGN